MTVHTFTYRSAYSQTIVVAVSGVVLIESTVLHMWLSAQHPLLAWLLTASSLLTLLWFWRDDARYRRGVLTVDAAQITLQVGTRWTGVIARDLVSAATRPRWQDVPASGTAAANAYVNVTKPADPNVLLELREPVLLRAFGLVNKNVRRIGVHLDTPDELIALLQRNAS